MQPFKQDRFTTKLAITQLIRAGVKPVIANRLVNVQPPLKSMSSALPAKRPIRVSEVVESGVEGLLLFLGRLLRTLWTTTARPRMAFRLIMKDRHARRPQFVMPFTYAAIGMFLLSVVTKAADSNVIDWIWMSKEIGANISQRLTSELSMVSIAIGAIPALMGLFAVSYLQAFILRLPPPSRYRLLVANCYAIGTQAMYLFLFAGLLTAQQIESSGISDLNTVLVNWIGYAFIVLLLALPALALLVVPAFLIFSIRWRQTRIHKYLRPLVALIISALSVLGLLLYPILADIPNKARKLGTAPAPPSVTREGDAILSWRQGTLFLEADVLFSNPTDAWVHISSSSSFGTVEFDVLASRADTSQRERNSRSMPVEKMLDETGRDIQLTSIPPKSFVWRRVYASADAPNEAEVLNTLKEESRPCVQLSFRRGGQELQSGCAFGSIRLRK